MKKSKLTIAQIRELHRAGLLEEAKVGYLSILRINPRDVEALHSLGVLCAQQENYVDAIQYLETALKYQPENPMVNLHLANILKLQGLFSQAEQVLLKTLNAHPHFVAALNNLGTVYYAQAKLDDAIQFYRQAIAHQADYADAYYNLGLALSKKDDWDAAIETYQKLLELSPEHFAARFHIACVLMRKDKIEEAIAMFLQIEQAHPNHFETQINLATCYLKKGKLNEAKTHYLKALELSPQDTQTLFNLGVINMQQGEVDNAIQFYQRAIQINANDFATQNNLGVAFLAKQHANFALQHFREALRIQPDNKSIQHTVNVLSQNQHLLTSPPDYVKSLFDSYADHYEPHLLTALEYHVPELLFAAVSEVSKPFPSAWNILDLGCGTGLCGTPFKPFAKSLIGVDLSPKMLEVAAQKNIYDELITDELAAFLKNKVAVYDLIIAGDVLVYIGDLAETFQLSSAALREKGLFVFNTEIIENNDFKMNQSGRFAHSKKYIETLAQQYQLKVLAYKTATTRMQNNEPVLGHLFVLQRP